MKRNLFAELKEGFDALKAERQGKITLRTHEVQKKPEQNGDGARLSGVPRKNRAPSAYSYVTAKGQIVIPSNIRWMFGIKEGTRVRVDVDEQAHRIILTPVTRDYIQNLRGKYKGKGLLAALAAEKKRERGL